MPKTQAIPKHLKRYFTKQNYSRYTPQDHAVWRFILRELTQHLYKNGHPTYKPGLSKTGITLNKIPSISHIDKCLKKLGWRAACVSGFIPPAAFMEMQSFGILPIATEMRRIENLEYTPAPDIVHEAAGHAPMLANKEYSKYLRRYAEIASKAIITKKDMEQYEAIRELSDLKELPGATQEQINKAYERLKIASEAIKEPTEAVLLSRMAWWTTEYGLIGDVHNHKIIGAGLLSSVGESRTCLKPTVKKIPFSIDCTKFPYDITDPQPQLFVAKDFKDLEKGLEALSEQMAYKRGGSFGLSRMVDAETVNTIELCSGLQISGILDFYRDINGEPYFLKLKGPVILSYKNKQLKGHGKKYHSQGYSTPVGIIKNFDSCLSQVSDNELKKRNMLKGKYVELEYSSGVKVKGVLKNILRQNGKLLVLTFENCTVTKGSEVLFRPEWGNFDLGSGCDVVSVFGGAADRIAYGETDDFVAKKLPPRKFSDFEKQKNKMYEQINKYFEGKKYSEADILRLMSQLENHNDEWLLRFEILELAQKKKWTKKDWYKRTKEQVLQIGSQYPNIEPYIKSSLEKLERA